MYKRELKGRQILITDSGEDICLDYYLITENQYYSIEVIKIMNGCYERERTFKIEGHKLFVENIVRTLYENKVTPMCLLNHVDELLYDDFMEDVCCKVAENF